MSKLDEKADQLRELRKDMEIIELESMNYKLSDAIREGSLVTVKSEGWGDGDKACALHSAIIAAHSRGYAQTVDNNICCWQTCFMRLSEYDKSHFSESGTKNSNTLNFCAAKCADCDKWFPARFMFWDDKNLCVKCFDKTKEK